MRGTLPLSWTELLRRTWRDSMEDDILGMAAQLAYYFFLALFPAVLFLLALASFFPLSNLTDDLARTFGPLVSPQVIELIQEQMRRLAENESGGLLTLGVAGGVIVLLLWFYVSSIALLAGAELNAEIEHASPYGKSPGQKNAHGRRLLGRRAERWFHTQSQAADEVP